MAINDIVEDLADIPSAEVTRLYKVVNTAGLITLSELRHRYSSSFKQVGTRGLIRDEIEYHLINGIVVDQSSDIDAEERKLFQQLLDAHE
jgi:hypothetical protein